MDTNTKANRDFIKARAKELTEQARRASLYPEMLVALKGLYNAWHNDDISSNTPTGGKAIRPLKTLIARCEKERIQ